MTRERWQQVRTILAGALQLEGEARSAYLGQTCSSDQVLRHEVESLLAADEQAQTSFLQSPPLVMRLEKGTRLGDYEIQAMLGAGGMGEVYRARDSRLRRDVAIKVLPAFVSSDPERLWRFEQEATAAAALNHPNVLAVHQLGTHEGTPYLVSELLEGETLREQVKRGRTVLRKVIDYGVQIARGLAAAHEKGIVHRDLKPENLFVTKDGQVKILDFGLAKLRQSQSGSEHSLPTLSNGTEADVIMGTVGYMSPEQVRGEAADSRSDIFAFGAILYEMLTGRRAFHKPTSAETLEAILNQDLPAISQADLPPALERVVNRCLEKNPEQRFQSASDLAFALDALSDPGASSIRVLDVMAKSRSSRWWLGFASIMLIAAALIGWLTTSSPVLFTFPSRLPRVLEYTQVTQFGAGTIVAPWNPIATDGSRLYFSELTADHFTPAQLSIQGGEAVPLVTPFRNTTLLDIDSSGSELLVASSSGLETEKPLWAVPILAGSPRRLGDLVGHDGTWSPDREKLVFATGPDLYLARGDGTQSRKLVGVNGTARWPRWSPDGSVLRFTVDDPHTNSSSLWEIKADGTQLHAFLPGWNVPSGPCCGTWTVDAKYFVFQSTHEMKPEVWVIGEKGRGFERASGKPVQLTAGPMNMQSPVPSKDGKKLFFIGTLPRGELARYDSKSRQFVPYLSGMSAEHLAFSRNGEWLTYITYPGAYLWRSKTDGTERIQLTFSPMLAASPTWSPDGKQIAFFGRTPGRPWRIHLVPAEGGGSQELATGERNQADPTWSPDGSVVAYDDLDAPFAIHLLELRTGKISKLASSDGLWSPSWSPDGRFIAAKRFGSEELVLFDVAAQRWKPLAQMTVGYLNWSWRSNYVYFDTWLGNDPAIYKVRIGDGHIERLASLDKLHSRTWGSWGPWTGIAPDDSPLILRDISSQGIYAMSWDLP